MEGSQKSWKASRKRGRAALEPSADGVWGMGLLLGPLCFSSAFECSLLPSGEQGDKLKRRGCLGRAVPFGEKQGSVPCVFMTQDLGLHTLDSRVFLVRELCQAEDRSG